MALKLLQGVIIWHFENWCMSWNSAFHQPCVGARFIGLAVGLLLTCIIGRHVFESLGIVPGIAYCTAAYLAMSSATFFKIRRVGVDAYVPLGIIIPFVMLLSVVVSVTIRPAIGAAIDTAMARHVVDGLVNAVTFGAVPLCLRILQGEDLY